MVDIDKILNDLVVPEMECDPNESAAKTSARKKSKSKTTNTVIPRSVTLDDVPEVVLPKTKAEVYNAAKDRLTEKTSAVSKRKKPVVKKPASPTASATGTSLHARAEVAAAVRPERVRRPVENPSWVGTEDELVPFAWRMPLITDIARQSKVYRQAVRDANATMLPVPREK